MKKRQFWISILAGLMAAIMLFGLIASAIPFFASAKSSAQIKEEINALKEQMKDQQSEISRLEGQLSANMDKMEDIVARKNVIFLFVKSFYRAFKSGRCAV